MTLYHLIFLLSPYLFIIFVEGLSSLFRSYVDRGLIYGCRVARSAPPVSHLFFADDSFFFFNATMDEVEMVKQCLNAYEMTLGQCINFQKSSISFSVNTSEEMRSTICDFLGV